MLFAIPWKVDRRVKKCQSVWLFFVNQFSNKFVIELPRRTLLFKFFAVIWNNVHFVVSLYVANMLAGWNRSFIERK